MRSYRAVVVLLVALLPACGNDAPAPAPVRNAVALPESRNITGRPLTVEELSNATYIGTDKTLIEMKNGEWSDPAQDRKITLLKTTALAGDLNGDGREESVGFYSDRVGKIETFNFAVMVVADGKIHVIASATVGTGVALVSARLADQRVIVEVRNNGRNERLQWTMKDGALTKIADPS